MHAEQSSLGFLFLNVFGILGLFPMHPLFLLVNNQPHLTFVIHYYVQERPSLWRRKFWFPIIMFHTCKLLTFRFRHFLFWFLCLPPVILCTLLFWDFIDQKILSAFTQEALPLLLSRLIGWEGLTLTAFA